MLKQYLAHCRMTHALAFFQWRYVQLKESDPNASERNKDIFYQRVDALLNHMELSFKYKKKIFEAEAVNKTQQMKVDLKKRKVINSLKTDELNVLAAQKNDTSLFTSLPMDKKNKVASFEFIGMADPSVVQ